MTWRLVFSWTRREQRGRDVVESLDVAGLERGHGGRRVGHRLEDDLVEVDVAAVVPVGRLDHGDVVADDAVVEHERPGAHRVRCEVRALVCECRRREHVRVGPNAESRCVRWKTTVYGPRRDAVDDREVARADRAGSQEALNAGDDGLGVERRAVVELDPLPELNRVAQLVLRELGLRGCEQRQLAPGP